MKSSGDDRQQHDGSSPGEVPRMPSGSRYAGQDVEISSRRSIEIVPDPDGHVGIEADDRHVVVNYFYHEGQFWTAVIPLDGVESVFGQAFNFSAVKTKPGKDGPEILLDKHGLPRRKIPTLNHLQSRFTLAADHPIELYPMDVSQRGDPAHRIHDFVYTFEAVGPAGVGFNIRDGLRGNLVCAHRFLSTREMVFERIVVENQYVTESPPLPLKEGQRRTALVKSILRSHQAGMTEAYYLYRFCGTNNCTSSPFHILDSIVDYTPLQRLGSMLYRLPLSPRFYLRVRGLDSDRSQRNLVRDEFADYIGDPETRERKRAFFEQRKSTRRAAGEADAAGAEDRT